MNINYTPKKGVKLLGAESGAWLNDSIDNDDQILISNGLIKSRLAAGKYTVSPQVWTENPGANGTIAVTKEIITLTEGSLSNTVYVTTPITTVIGQTYSVHYTILSKSSTIQVLLRLGDSTDGAGNRFTIAVLGADIGVYIDTFIATQTTHYIHIMITTPADRVVILKNEIEIRTAEIIGVDETTEINTIANAVNPTSDSNATTGFSSVGLIGTGLNVFEVVNNNESYPELHTSSNAAADAGGNEANATTGFTASNNAVLTSVSSPVNTGSFAISVENNTTPSAGGGCFIDLTFAPISMLVGRRYKISVDVRHNGVGGNQRIFLGTTTIGGGGAIAIGEPITSSDITYQPYSLAFTFDGSLKYLVFREESGTDDGGLYVDNLSITQTNEYYPSENAASDTLSEKDSVSNWVAHLGGVLTSVNSPVDTGSFALSVESNTTPTNTGGASIDLDSSLIGLTEGKRYIVTVNARHNGTGGLYGMWLAGAPVNTSHEILVIDSADTTYIEYSLEFTHDATTRYLTTRESSGSDDGGIYIDNISIKEVQVNHGTYAFHANSNDTPTANARIYLNIETNYSLIVGKRYAISIDVKHLGVGGDWQGSIGQFNTGGVFFIAMLSNLDNSYVRYGVTFIHSASTIFLAFVENNGSNDGGVYIDKLSIKETAEFYPTGNAASDATSEGDNVGPWDASDSSVSSSVTSPIDVGSYALSFESNTFPHASARGFLDLSALGLQLGITYSISYRARHNGTGGNYIIGLFSANNGGASAAQDNFVNSDTTYLTYSYTFIHASNSLFLVCIENNVGNDGGVYVDNVTIREITLPDLSNVNKGLYTFGLIDKHIVNYNADTMSFSGFSATQNYIKQAHNTDLDYPDDWHYSIWFKLPDTTIGQVMILRAGYSGGFVGGGGIQIQIINGGFLRLQLTRADFGGQNDTVTGSLTADDNLWHLAVIQRLGDDIYMYLDAVLDIQQALVNTPGHANFNSNLWIGTNAGVNVPFLGEISEVTTGPFAFTSVEIQNKYESEKILYQRDSAFSIFDGSIDLPIRSRSLSRSTETQRTQNISLGGQRETLFTRQNNLWETNTTLIDIIDLKYYRLFLDSVVQGQLFTFDPDGSAVAPSDPRLVTYEDSKYSEVREGQLNKFRIQFKVKE